MNKSCVQLQTGAAHSVQLNRKQQIYKEGTCHVLERMPILSIASVLTFRHHVAELYDLARRLASSSFLMHAAILQSLSN